MHDIIQNILGAIVNFVEALGYLGIFIMTFVEGTFVPIPSEITLIPAGYLSAKGVFNPFLLFLTSVLGTLAGVLFNYFIAYHYGRKIVLKYGKYIFFSQEKLYKMEIFFRDHGPFSTFIGRILPGLKHFISFPAGLARMDIKLFCLYSAAGGGIWCAILILLGYFIGNNSEELSRYLHQINYLIIAIVIISFVTYIAMHKRKVKKQNQYKQHGTKATNDENHEKSSKS